MNINSRVGKIIEEKGLNHTEFANEVGVQRSVISHVVSGRNRPGVELLQNILERYPEIQPNWLLLGKGNMKKMDEKMNQEKEGDNKEREVKGENSPGNQQYSQKNLFEEEDKKEADSVNQPSSEGGKKEPASIDFEGNGKIRRITVYFANGYFRDFYPSNE